MKISKFNHLCKVTGVGLAVLMIGGSAKSASIGFGSKKLSILEYDPLNDYKLLYPEYKYKRRGAEIAAEGLIDGSPWVVIHDVNKSSEDKSSSNKENTLRVLNNGLASFYKRIEMIRSAKETLELEYFIFRIREKNGHINDTTRFIVHELIEAANRGVKVRLLIDKSGTVFDFDESLVSATKEMVDENKRDNFQVKYYNDVSLARLVRTNFRNHRKLLAKDSNTEHAEAMTGGRNIEDKYFDVDPKYNFLDRDVVVKGPIVREGMTKSFDKFWDSKISVKPKLKSIEESLPALKDIKVGGIVGRGRNLPKEKLDEKRKQKRASLKLELEKQNIAAKKLLEQTSTDRTRLKTLVDEGKKNYNNKTVERTCPKTIFTSDVPLQTGYERFKKLHPRKNYKEKFRIVERVIGDQITRMIKNGDEKGSSKEMYVSTPYSILNSRSAERLREILKNDVKLHIFTNTLASTDAFYNAGHLYKSAKAWAKYGIGVNLHKSTYLENGNDVADIDTSAKNVRWGIHSKSHVYGDDAIYIGTYNIDNRSSFYNTEMGVVCEGSKELAADLRDSIKERIKETGYRVLSDNEIAENSNAQGLEERLISHGIAKKKEIIVAEDNKSGEMVDAFGPAKTKDKKLMKGTKGVSILLQFLQ